MPHKEISEAQYHKIYRWIANKKEAIMFNTLPAFHTGTWSLAGEPIILYDYGAYSSSRRYFLCCSDKHYEVLRSVGKLGRNKKVIEESPDDDL